MKMEILVFLFVVSNINLVLAEEKESKEVEAAYKIHSEPEEVPENDQLAESSHSVVRNYGVIHDNQYKSQNQILSRPLENLNGADLRYTYNEQNVQQQVPKQEVSLQEDLRHDATGLNHVGLLQPSLPQDYNHGAQQIYLQHYPLQTIRILGPEASPLRQIHENGRKTLGYSSYVEHVTEKDEEEIKSALKEGSIGDIKRLVPKSGISFQIYQTDKNANLKVGNQKTETHVHSKFPKGYSHDSNLQYRVKPEIPATQFKIQPAYEEHQQPIAGLEESQQTYLKNKVQHQQNGYKTSQDILQPIDATFHSQEQQDVTGQTHFYTQPFNLNSQKTSSEANEKSTLSVKPYFKINVEDNSYSKAATVAGFNSLNANKGSKHTLSDINNLQYQKQWSFDTKSEGSQKLIKNIKRPTTLQYDKSLLIQAEATTGLHHVQNHKPDIQSNINKHKTLKSVTETSKNNADVSHLSNSNLGKISQNDFAEHLAKKAYLDKETANSVINRLSDNYIKSENVKTSNHIISHLGTSAYSDSLATKDNYRERFSTNIYPDSETAKSSKHNLISHVDKSSFSETKNNFDHQKALEGSTSFDIKNAIDNTGNLVHQTNYISSTAEVHPFEDIQKQQLAYVVPKIPASTVLIDNSIHETPIIEGHSVKEFGQTVLTSPHLSYPTVSSPEVTSKFFHQPQTILWTPEHLKQENDLTSKGFHQPLIKLHLPKEEIYKLVETPNVELPTSSISHISFPQQKQPYVLHYNIPLIKHPQEIHFQPKTKIRIQNGQPSHIKLAQPITMDWNLFKSTLPSYNTLALKPELSSHVTEIGKKIVPILVRKRKNRSNNQQEIGVVYGKVNNNRRPTKPNHRHEKNVRINLLHEVPTKNQFEGKEEKKNEFSVSASYKVDRSLQSPGSS